MVRPDHYCGSGLIDGSGSDGSYGPWHNLRLNSNAGKLISMPKITFEPTFMSAEVVEVEVSGGVSIQEAAEDAGVPMGDACGGNCGCSTCHVHILQGFSSLDEMEDDEDDILGKADDVQHHSRLGCQAFCEF